jgi:hypothetical protein
MRSRHFGRGNSPQRFAEAERYVSRALSLDRRFDLSFRNYGTILAWLGKPLWLLLPFHPGFRWLRDREDSPWYPTARLFRQTQDGDWSDVLTRIAAELKILLEANDADALQANRRA